MIMLKMFPSPLGDLYISIITQKKEANQKSSFRPLSGTYISQSCRMAKAEERKI